MTTTPTKSKTSIVFFKERDDGEGLTDESFHEAYDRGTHGFIQENITLSIVTFAE